MFARRFTSLAVFLLLSGSLAGISAAKAEDEKSAAKDADPDAVIKDVTQGALRIVKDDGGVVECPLKHTDVKADIAGFIARVRVTQTFANPTDEKIEAVYVFPLPHESAVDDMTMVIGDRKIVGLIKRRDEARRVYEEALAAGQTAALLEQERPNIFTQSVGNIEPGQEVKIEISYVDVLKYDVGTYEFHFPVVVGPRYNPGYPTGGSQPKPQELQGKVSPPQPNTSRVPDASRINPPVLKPGFRNGHDISLSVSLDAGVPIQDLKSANHETKIERDGDRRATVVLSAADSIPNKDFILRYGVVGKKPEMALLAHTGDYTDAKRLGNGYFMLMIQPKEDDKLKKSPPREIVFLVDVSGSMSGGPTAKVRETMDHMLKLCRPIDTVQVITFAGSAQQLFERPVPVNEDNIKTALNFTRGLRGGGGTEMLKGIKRAIDQPIDKERLRVVVMLSDGYIGNEAEIVEHVGKNCGDQIRFWAIGIGQAPNMFLIDGVARQGGGMGKKLGLNDDSESLSLEVISRIQRAQLAKIKIDWGDLQVAETYPARIPELWAGAPVVVFGRYADGGTTEISISGTVEGDDVRWPLEVTVPKQQPANDVLAKVWARKKIEDLMHQTYYQGSPAVEEMVTALALDYRLMSQYTSFVAVDEKDAGKLETPARPPRRMLVPVPLPEGTRWEGFFGGEMEEERLAAGVIFKAEEKSVQLQLSNGRSSFQSRLNRGYAVDALRKSAGQLSRLNRNVAGPFANSPHPTAAPMPALKQAAKGPASKARELAAAVPGRPFATGPSGSRAAFPNSGGGGFALGGDGLFDGRAVAGDKSISDEAALADYNYTAAAVQAQFPSLQKAAEEAVKRAKALQEKDNLAAARAEWLRAYMIDAAMANVGYFEGEIAAQAEGELENMHQQQVEAWAKTLPGLNKKLDLIVRNRSIEEALAAIAAAAGAKIDVQPGSLADAAALTGDDEVRVDYLDLRGATVTQALDWTLRPARMNWSVAGNRIVAGVERRGEGSAPWVYDVSLLAVPSAKELNDLKDYQKAVTASREAAEQFVKAVREAVKADEPSVFWFAPGQLVVFGNAPTHATAARLFKSLADPKAKLEGAAAALHATTVKRAETRKESAEKIAAARRRLDAAAAHDYFAWQLLAAAADGNLDLEALTQLQIAWSSAATQELLKGAAAPVVARSLWAVTAAARCLPDATELQALAGQAAKLSAPAVEASLAELEKKPQDVGSFAVALYGALASGDATLRGTALQRLSAATAENSPLAAWQPIVAALLNGAKPAEQTSLADLVASDEVAGDDMVALTALACRRAGGEAWSALRRESRHLIGDQPLSGSVVVFVNRLSAAPAPLVASNN